MSRRPFKKEVIDEIFKSTTRTVSGSNPRQVRRDFKNKIIARAAYGNENSAKGWNIHHKDGNKNNNAKDNLQALHYETHKELHENE